MAEEVWKDEIMMEKGLLPEGYGIFSIQDSKYSEAIRLLQTSFYRDEQLISTLRRSPSAEEAEGQNEEWQEAIDRDLDRLMYGAVLLPNAPPSLVVVYKPTGLIVAVSLLTLQRPGEPGVETILPKLKTRPIRALLNYLLHLDKRAKIMTKLQVSSLLEVFMLGVLSTHRRLGLAKSLITAAELMGRSLKVGGVYGCYTTTYSARAAVNQEVLLRDYPESYIDTNDVQVFAGHTTEVLIKAVKFCYISI